MGQLLKADFLPKNIHGKEILENLLQQPTIASKKSLYHTYDSQVRTSTVVGPGSDAAVLRIRGTNKALAMTTDCNARYLYLNPEIGGQIAVSEAARNIVCSGGKPLAITDCLNYGNPENPEIYWELWHSADGIATACRELDTPVISGNVSLYNECNGEAIYPTPMIGMVGLIEKTEYITTQNFKSKGDSIYLVGETTTAFNGSELQKMLVGRIEGKLPAFDLATEKEHQELVLEAIHKGLIASAHDLSEGGLGVALAESLFGTEELGAKITVDMDSSLLFSETQSRFLLSVAPEKEVELTKLFNEKAVKIGEVTGNAQLEITTNNENIHADVTHLNKLWEEAISCLMKKKA